MKQILLALAAFSAGGTVSAAAFEQSVTGVATAPVLVRCREPGDWRIDVARMPQRETGVGELEIRRGLRKWIVPFRDTYGCCRLQ